MYIHLEIDSLLLLHTFQTPYLLEDIQRLLRLHLVLHPKIQVLGEATRIERSRINY